MSNERKRGVVRSDRSRRQRIAAGAVLASTTLLGTYLAAVRPQPTYASPHKGGAGQGQDLGPSGRAFAAFTVPACQITVDDSTQLHNAILSSVDDSVICIDRPITLTQSLPLIDDTRLTLVGNGGGDDTIMVSADDSAAVGSLLTADLTADDTLTIANLGFQGGQAQDTGASSARGGAIRVTGGSLVVHDSTFTGNSTVPVGATGRGGAVSVQGNAYIYGSTFSNNAVFGGSGSSGGALFVQNKTVIGAGNSFMGNTAVTRGGAVYAPNGPISVTGSVFTANTGGNGAAVSVRNFTGVMPIVDSVFEGNRAASLYGYGGAVLTYGTVDISGASVFKDNYATDGGAVYAWGATITGATFTGNEATERGGAVYVFGRHGDATISDSTFTGNQAVIGGGAIYAAETPSHSRTLSIDNSGFSANEARDAGAVHWSGSDDTIAIADSSFVANLAVNGGDGGALALIHDSNSALAQIESSSFTGNSSEDDGGAIRLSGPVEMSIRKSSLTGNRAVGSGSGAGGALAVASNGLAAGEATLTNTFVGYNYAETYAGGLYAGAGGSLSLVFSTVYDDSVADVTYPSGIYVSNTGAFTAIGSAVGNSANLPVVHVDNTATFDDTYLVVAGPTIGLVGIGSRSVPSGTLDLAALDNTSTPGQGGRSPREGSVLLEAASTSGLGTGVIKDQLNADRPTPGGSTWTIGARQLAAGGGPSPTPTPTPTPATPPSVPRDVRAVPGDRSVVVSWAAPSSAGSFPVSTYVATATPGGQSCLVAAPALTCTVTGLANGSPYTFTVQALNGAGWSPASAPSSVVRPGGDTPAPEPQPLPAPLAPGEALLQVNGVPDPNVSVNPNADDDGLQIKGDGWTMDLDGLGPDGKPLNLGPDGELRLQDERDVVTEGKGFLANSEVDLYLDPPVETSTAGARALGEAIYVGTVRTDASGNFAGTATLPEDIAPGEHVLQATGYSAGRQARAMSLGVVVEPSLVLDKGTRTAAGRHDRIRTTGSSTGIEVGTRLTPWIRYNGQTAFTKGKATITVQSDGTFRWTRQIRKDKGITAYVSYVDVKSNEVLWAKVR